ncbi:beta-galactosidase [Rhodococcoides fascians]|uniref:beta-galactosidase n=1 Tax=Rhodococcoides fascians TaxID=1828 RepID=UPI00055B7F0D|nr:beta-galactosidase [Rhodococcus fascians]
MTLRTRLITVAAAVALALGVTAPAAQAAPPSGLGFSSGAPFLLLDDATLSNELVAGREVGASWVRVVVNWAQIETAPGVFDWGNTDRVVDAARAQGYSVLAVVAGTPAWAQGPIPSLLPGAVPVDPNTYGAFAGAAAAHLGNRVDSYEVWNEPNIPSFFAPVDAARYVGLLRAAYPAIHTADPGATVLSAGLATTIDTGAWTVAPVTFLQQMYAAGAGGFMDAVALHPYTFPFTVENDPNGQWAQVDQAYGTMAANGDGGKKIWITELGAPTGNGPMAVTEEAQATIIGSSLAQASRLPYVGPVFVHALRDAGADAFDSEQNYGLLRADFSRKPSFAVVQGS